MLWIIDISLWHLQVPINSGNTTAANKYLRNSPHRHYVIIKSILTMQHELLPENIGVRAGRMYLGTHCLHRCADGPCGKEPKQNQLKKYRKFPSFFFQLGWEYSGPYQIQNFFSGFSPHLRRLEPFETKSLDVGNTFFKHCLVNTW